MSTPAPVSVHPSADLNFTPAPVIVNSHTATPEAVAAGITANQQQMQKVNDLSRGGSARSRSRSSKKVKPHSRRRHIRTYRRRGRGHQQQQQNGGAAAAGAIIIPQAPGQATCSEGPQCAGAQNANLTSVLNQAKSSGANDAYAVGGKKRMRKTRNSQKRRKSHHRQ